jgi:predicted nucleic acid-binding protein
MVLVDTSIWIRALAGREPFAGELDELLVACHVAGHELVYGELFIGDSEAV